MGTENVSNGSILALDLGTSSCRSALFDTRANRLPETTAQQTYALTTTPDGGAELDPEVLLRAIRGCLAETLSKADEGSITAVGVSCFWHSLIGTDANGRARTPIYTWADSRCREDAARLRKEFGEKKLHARTGCMVRTSFWPAKLRWLRRTRRKEFQNVQRWMSPAEWLQIQFCGSAYCALGMATGTGLFDPRQLRWDAALLEHCRVAEASLNPLGDEPATLLPAILAEFPALAGARWFPAIGDGAASNLGSGATQPGLAAINVGTSAALRVMLDGPDARAPFGLFCYRVDAQRFLIGGAVSNAGNLRAWCLRELNLPKDPAEIEHALASRPAPAHGLNVLPFWSAERAPTWREDLQGAIQGLTQSTTALDLLQATTEAVYYRLARIAAMVAKHTGSVPKFIVSGGIQKSPDSIQRLTDVLNARVYPNDEPEASIRGAAVFVLEKLGQKFPATLPAHPLLPRKQYAALHQAKREEQQVWEEQF